ncbi:hypothetical protein [Streptomyces lateritius]|uniref:hypothetical protein n=1 Tax=Streptomyces lateritius TaxID=67313 RepID=UPI0016796380|nr:hypothetical protein [Streptomyces lateritius]GGU15978.1 hypothetical protein GCM10010272_70820 [Streptomyces lateritius]
MRGRTTRRRSRTRGALLALVLLCAGAAPLTGCSSGSEGEDRTPETGVVSDATNTTDATATAGTTGGGDQDEDAQERRRREKDSGNFSRAGRLSDAFGGFFPEHYEKFVVNPSSEPYVGTVSVVDCSPDGKRQPMSPSSRTVTVPPKTEGKTFGVPFKFPRKQGNVTSNKPRIICVTLRDEGGVRGQDKDPLSVQLNPTSETTGEVTGETTTGETTGETTTGETTGETTTGETTGETTTGETTGETTTGETTTGETTGETTTEETTGETTGETTDGGTGESGGVG